MEKNIITINRKLETFSKEFEINADIIVPDIKPDILSIINSNGNAYIYREEILNNRIRIDGNIENYTVYLSDNGETRSIQSTLSFSESFESSKITENTFLKSRVILENIESKMLNERKISINAKLKLIVNLYQKEEVEIGLNIDEQNLEGVQKLEETIETKNLIGSNKVKTSIKENIKAEDGEEIAEILKTSITVNNIENKISFNKVLSKADGNIKILYITENGKIETINKTIPIMSFIDLEGVQENQECEVEYWIKNMLFKIDPSEKNTINVQIDFEVSLEVYENKKIEIIQDIYGIKNNVNLKKKEILIPINNEINSEKINLSEKLLIENILKIYDVDICINKIKDSECEAVLKICYEIDNRSGLNQKEFRIPFIIKNSPNNDYNFEITREQFTVSGENVDCDIGLLYKENDSNYKNINIIENIEIEESSNDEDYKIYMYIVKEGDTMWKIAKNFRINMDDLIKLNNLENPDKINIGDRIFVMR